jgi:hypothetical protein
LLCEFHKSKEKARQKRMMSQQSSAFSRHDRGLDKLAPQLSAEVARNWPRSTGREPILAWGGSDDRWATIDNHSSYEKPSTRSPPGPCLWGQIPAPDEEDLGLVDPGQRLANLIHNQPDGGDDDQEYQEE